MFLQENVCTNTHGQWIVVNPTPIGGENAHLCKMQKSHARLPPYGSWRYGKRGQSRNSDNNEWMWNVCLYCEDSHPCSLSLGYVSPLARGMKLSTVWFITFSLGIAWSFLYLILGLFALIAVERVIEYFVYRKRKKGGKWWISSLLSDSLSSLCCTSSFRLEVVFSKKWH